MTEKERLDFEVLRKNAEEMRRERAEREKDERIEALQEMLFVSNEENERLREELRGKK